MLKKSQDQEVSESTNTEIGKPIDRVADFRLLLAVNRTPTSTLYYLLAAMVVVVSIAWRVSNLDAFSLSNDEGAYLMWAWLVHSGHPLYSETVSVSAPLFIVLLDWAFDLGGVSLVTGRALVLGFFGLTLISLAWAGRLLGRWLPGLVAAIAFSLAPLAFSLSRMTMGEIPAVALAILSLTLALAYWRHGGQVWLAFSGFALGLSILTKALNPLVVLPILWLILARHRNRSVSWSKLLMALGVWGLAGLLPVVICLLAYDWKTMYDQVVAFRFELREPFPWRPSDNLVWLKYFVRQQWGIVGLALAGIVLAAVRKEHWQALVLLGLWLGGALLTILAHSPLFPHHTIILLPPLALLAGIGFSETVDLLRERRWTLSTLGIAGSLAFLLAVPSTVRANQTVRAASFGREAEAIAFLAQITRPTDNVLSDNLLLPFMAGRQDPPPLGDLAQVAIESGRQSSQRLIALSEAYPVEAVANWALRLPYLEGYMDWVEDNYLVRRVWDDHHIIYFGRKVPANKVPNPQSVKFSDGINLIGFDVQISDGENRSNIISQWLTPPSQRQQTNRWLNVTLYWTSYQLPTHNYTVFVHFYDSAGNLVASHDGPPLFGYFPTLEWITKEVIPDRHDMVLPDNLPSGEFWLVAGMYDPTTSDRLPLLDAEGKIVGDSIQLKQVTIENPE